MKAIIIEEKDAKSLLNMLEFAKYRDIDPYTPRDEQTVHDVHRHFHYVVTKWLQEQGCDAIR